MSHSRPPLLPRGQGNASLRPFKAADPSFRSPLPRGGGAQSLDDTVEGTPIAQAPSHAHPAAGHAGGCGIGGGGSVHSGGSGTFGGSAQLPPRPPGFVGDGPQIQVNGRERHVHGAGGGAGAGAGAGGGDGQLRPQVPHTPARPGAGSGRALPKFSPRPLPDLSVFEPDSDDESGSVAWKEKTVSAHNSFCSSEGAEDEHNNHGHGGGGGGNGGGGNGAGGNGIVSGAAGGGAHGNGARHILRPPSPPMKSPPVSRVFRHRRSGSGGGSAMGVARSRSGSGPPSVGAGSGISPVTRRLSLDPNDDSDDEIDGPGAGVVRRWSREPESDAGSVYNGSNLNGSSLNGSGMYPSGVGGHGGGGGVHGVSGAHPAGPHGHGRGDREPMLISVPTVSAAPVAGWRDGRRSSGGAPVNVAASSSATGLSLPTSTSISSLSAIAAANPGDFDDSDSESDSLGIARARARARARSRDRVGAVRGSGVSRSLRLGADDDFGSLDGGDADHHNLHPARGAGVAADDDDIARSGGDDDDEEGLALHRRRGSSVRSLSFGGDGGGMRGIDELEAPDSARLVGDNGAGPANEGEIPAGIHASHPLLLQSRAPSFAQLKLGSTGMMRERSGSFKALGLESKFPGVSPHNVLSSQVPFGANPAADSTHLEKEFFLVRELGSGSFGHVFEVVSRRDGQRYAVKMSRRQWRGKKDKQAMLQEVRNFAVLGVHPHVVTIHTAWTQNHFMFIQTELCEHGSLATHIDERGIVEEPVVWNWLVDIALGLRHIHLSRIVHLDIKPENIMLSANGSLKIGDLGIAVQEGAWEDGIEGDATYLAPELLMDEKQVHHSADIFSFGCSMLEIAANVNLPRNGAHWQRLRRGQVDFPPQPQRSEDLRALICSMMSADPRDRPDASDILAHPRCAAILRSRGVDDLDALGTSRTGVPIDLSLNTSASSGSSSYDDAGVSATRISSSSWDSSAIAGVVPGTPHAGPAASKGGKTATDSSSSTTTNTGAVAAAAASAAASVAGGVAKTIAGSVRKASTGAMAAMSRLVSPKRAGDLPAAGEGSGRARRAVTVSDDEGDAPARTQARGSSRERRHGRDEGSARLVLRPSSSELCFSDSDESSVMASPVLRAGAPVAAKNLMGDFNVSAHDLKATHTSPDVRAARGDPRPQRLFADPVRAARDPARSRDGASAESIISERRARAAEVGAARNPSSSRRGFAAGPSSSSSSAAAVSFHTHASRDRPHPRTIPHDHPNHHHHHHHHHNHNHNQLRARRRSRRADAPGGATFQSHQRAATAAALRDRARVPIPGRDQPSPRTAALPLAGAALAGCLAVVPFPWLTWPIAALLWLMGLAVAWPAARGDAVATGCVAIARLVAIVAVLVWGPGGYGAGWNGVWLAATVSAALFVEHRALATRA